MGKEEVINFTIFGIACSFVATQKKGTFPVDGAVYRKYVPYCKKCNKKDSRTVIQNNKFEIVVSFENLVTNGFCILWKNLVTMHLFNSAQF